MNIEAIKNISFAIAEGSRKLMIDTILDHAGDEIEGKAEMYDLAIKNNSQLKFELIDILNYIMDEDEEN